MVGGCVDIERRVVIAVVVVLIVIVVVVVLVSVVARYVTITIVTTVPDREKVLELFFQRRDD